MQYRYELYQVFQGLAEKPGDTEVTNQICVVVVPFLQQRLLYAEIVQNQPEWNGFQIATANTYQGDENIFSFVDTTSAEHVEEKVRFVDHSNRLTVVTTRLKCGMMIFGDSNIYKHWGSGQQGADTEHESFNDIKNTKDEDDADSGYGGDDKVDEFEQITRKSGSKLL